MMKTGRRYGSTRHRTRVTAAAAVLSLALALGVTQAGAAPTLLLNADMEGESVMPSGDPAYDVFLLTTPSGAPGALAIQYEGGTVMDRAAEIAADPAKPGNNALRYWLKEASIPGQTPGSTKGRIQMNLANLNAALVYQRYRMYLPADLALYRAYPKSNTWFTINELWAGVPWRGDPFPFRISLDIVKDTGAGSPLWFAVSGSVEVNGAWRNVWTRVNKSFAVPIGEWLDVELGYKEGNATTGRFYLAVTRESNAARSVVFNVTNWTYHPLAPQPVPLTHWQPLKLYLSSDIIDFVRNNGGITQIYWDDLEIWKEDAQ